MEKIFKLDFKNSLIDHLDIILGQIGGYPMVDPLIKLAIRASVLHSIREKIENILKAKTEKDISFFNSFMENELLVVLRSISLVLAEIPQWEFATILGFEKTEAEEIYQIIDRLYSENKEIYLED